MRTRHDNREGAGRREAAFTLLEVMIAMAIFFMCIFSILGVVSRSLNQARNLEPVQIDPTAAFAELTLTNRLEEGPLPPEIVQDFERLNPGYSVSGNIMEVATNGLFQIDFVVGGVTSSGKRVAPSENSVLLFRPLSQTRRGPGLIRR